MIPLAIPNLCGNEARYLQECVATGFVSSVGPFVSRFEELVAAAAGTPGGVATSAGTTGLHLALVCAGVKPGDLVVTASFSFIATANAISHCGATPWLFDIDPQTWCLNADEVRRALKAGTSCGPDGVVHKATGRRVAAIMPVYTNGYIPEGFRDLAREFDLPLIADAAPAIGSTRGGEAVGRFADLTVFSFNGNKTVTSGGGGAIVGLEPSVLARAKHLSSTARVGADYDHDAVGFNYRMTNVEAAVGCAQMENLDRFVGVKRRIRDFYRLRLAACTGWSAFPDAPDKGNACWFSGCVLPEGHAALFDTVARALTAAGVQCRPFWKPIHLQEPYRSCPRNGMPVCESLWRRVVVLPSSTQITDAELELVATTIVDAFVASAR